MSADLYAVHRDAIERALTRVVGKLRVRPQDADDFKADLRLDFIQDGRTIIGAFRGGSAIDTYLFRVFLNRGISWLRVAHRAQARMRVTRALLRLAPVQLRLVRARTLDHSMADAAAACGMTREAGYSAYYRALRLLGSLFQSADTPSVATRQRAPDCDEQRAEPGSAGGRAGGTS
jgi:DNA-directed RNA polymerase specialized sigma24 family protein